MALFGSKKSVKKSEPAETKSAADGGSMQDLYSAVPVKKSTQPAARGAQPAGQTDRTGQSDQAGRILVKPLLTEKATNLAAVNKYVFVVAGQANKVEIAKAVRTIYGVKPLSVNIINRQGKLVSRGKVRGQRSDVKKAIVTLAAGQTIKIYEGV